MFVLTVLYMKAVENELKEFEQDIREGFATLKTSVDNFMAQIQSSMKDWENKWETKLGLFASSDL